jgi:cytochrome o ubiquinol oxidase subunit 2
MSKKLKPIILLALILVGTLVVYLVTQRHRLEIFNTGGIIADKERNLMITAMLMSLIVVVPVFIMLFTFAWRYRADNHKAKYTPDWDRNWLAETVWWGVPLILISILSVITWRSAHDLDPFKPISSNQKPLNVQVVALQWRWLFIYPDQKIATMNYFEMPVGRPVNFQITADAPMNSFWIPRLSGQMYAMCGMATELHVMADKPGNYRGSSANISGEGFAGMQFIDYVVDNDEFGAWVKSTQKSTDTISWSRYVELSKSTQNAKTASFTVKEPDLFDKIVTRDTTPSGRLAHAQPEETQ